MFKNIGKVLFGLLFIFVGLKIPIVVYISIVVAFFYLISKIFNYLKKKNNKNDDIKPEDKI